MYSLNIECVKPPHVSQFISTTLQDISSLESELLSLKEAHAE